MATLERTYTIPLRSGFRKSPKYYRTNRAVKTLRDFLVKHMKANKDKVRIGQHLNDELWRNGIKNPPPRITVVARKDEKGVVQVELLGKTYKDVAKPKERTQEPQGIKERLQAAVGGKKGASLEEKAEEESAEAPKKTPAKKAAAKKSTAKED